MQIELTDREAYQAEKIMDKARDDMLMGIAQLGKIASVSKDFEMFYIQKMKLLVQSFDLHQSICAKFETARLKGDVKSQDA